MIGSAFVGYPLWPAGHLPHKGEIDPPQAFGSLERWCLGKPVRPSNLPTCGGDGRQARGGWGGHDHHNLPLIGWCDERQSGHCDGQVFAAHLREDLATGFGKAGWDVAHGDGAFDGGAEGAGGDFA